jgi:hypothetical protein
VCLKRSVVLPEPLARSPRSGRYRTSSSGRGKLSPSGQKKSTPVQTTDVTGVDTGYLRKGERSADLTASTHLCSAGQPAQPGQLQVRVTSQEQRPDPSVGNFDSWIPRERGTVSSIPASFTVAARTIRNSGSPTGASGSASTGWRHQLLCEREELSAPVEEAIDGPAHSCTQRVAGATSSIAAVRARQTPGMSEATDSWILG